MGDAWGLGRLELSARSSLGEHSDRAWKQLTAGVPRGDLAGCSDKRFAIAHARTQELFPYDLGELYNHSRPPAPRQLRNFYGEFTFSWGFFWRDGDSLQTASFEHLTMHMDFDSPKVRAHQDFNISNSVFCVPADAPGPAM